MPKLVRSRHMKCAKKEQQWHVDWQRRLDAIVQHGLPAKVKVVSIAEGRYGFIGVELDVDELILPRSHAMRNFDLHLTLGFKSDYGEGIAEDAVARLNDRWRGEWLMIRVSRYTSGGTVELAADDLLYLDDDIDWLHSRGWYGNGLRANPRPLHISL